MIDQVIAAPLAAALTAKGYENLTAVQTAMLQPDAQGRDVLVSAQTGSGKTVAFGIAIADQILGGMDKLLYADNPLALVIAPTRELALQVARELEWLYASAGAVIATCVGGMDYRTEKRVLDRGAHIVVGTPGRLRDHIDRKSLNLSGLRAAVLDEADEMLDLGFREDLEYILAAAPEDRRTLMFSATVPKEIAKLAEDFQNNALRIAAQGEAKQHVDIEYRALSVATSDRENAIINLLRFYEAQNALVFCSTRAAVNHLMARFNNRSFSVVALSGELSQNERTHALQAMRDGRARVCIATDVAARGIDLPGLELVIHADLPGNRETLLHRSGRTGRAGNKGVSALIVTPGDRKKAERLLAAAAINATWARPPSAEEVTERDIDRLLSSDILAAQANEEETALVARILSDHAPEQIAAAFVRQWRQGKSAPEELRDSSAEPLRKDRQEFGESVWISLSVGRQQNAEPRWLLPMICGAGQITKTEIGAIRMLDDETHVQLAASCADGFFAAVGPELTLEKGITIRVMDRAPEGSRPSHPSAPTTKPHYRKSYDTDVPRRAPKPRYEDAPPKPSYRDRPADAVAPAEFAPKSGYVAEAPKYSPKADDAGDQPRRVYPPKVRVDPAPKSAPVKSSYDPDRANDKAPYRPREAPDAPKRAYGDKPAYDKPRGDKPAYDKPRGDKPAYDKPRAADGAPKRKFGEKPAYGAKPAYEKPSFDANDPSASRRKPGAKPAFGVGKFGTPAVKTASKLVGKSFSKPGSDAPKRSKPKS